MMKCSAKYTLWCGVIVSLLLFCPLSVHAQGGPTVTSVDSVAKFQAIPNDLAFELLGIDGDNIQQPGTISDFLASISPSIGLNGTLSPGIAISFAPYQLLEGTKLQLRDYIEDPWVRILSNTQISLGTAPTRGSDSSQDWGVGIRLVLLNTGDGRLDQSNLDRLYGLSKEALDVTPLPDVGGVVDTAFILLNQESLDLITKVISAKGKAADASNLNRIVSPLLDSLQKVMQKIDSQKYGESVDSIRAFIHKYRDHDYLTSAINARSAKSLKKMMEDNHDDPSWNTTSLDINIGTVYKSYGADPRKSTFSKYQAWLSFGYGGGNSQILLQAGIYHQFAILNQPDSTFATTAAMFRYGGEDLRFGAGVNALNFDHGTINIVAEIRLGSKAWIVPSFNREFAKNSSPTWSPNITIKTTGGAFGF